MRSGIRLPDFRARLVRRMRRRRVDELVRQGVIDTRVTPEDIAYVEELIEQRGLYELRKV
jgi:hypothetical protein